MSEVDEDEDIKSFKVVLVGESGVGKTSINNRFIKGTFSNNEVPTTSAAYSEKTLKIDEYEGITIKFDIWDTAGQEKYRSIGKIFYNDADIAIIVYDITNKDSFDEIKKYWYKQIEEFSPKNKNKF